MKTKRNIGVMYAIVLLQGMVFYGSVATLYRQAAGINIFQITLIESISLGLSIALEIPWGVIADKVGYRRTMIGCNILYFISKLVFWRANGFIDFLIERIMLGIIIAGLSGVDVSLLYLSCEEGESQKVFGIYEALGTAGLLISNMLFVLFGKGNLRISGLWTAISYGIAMVLSFALVEVKDKKAEETEHMQLKDYRQILKEIISDKKLIIFLISIAIFNEVHQLITVFFNQLQYTKCDISVGVIGCVYIVMTCVGLLGAFSKRITQKIGRYKSGLVIYIGAIVVCLLLGSTKSPVVSVAAIILLRGVFSIFTPLQMSIQNAKVKSSLRATALSMNAVFLDGIAIMMELLLGKIALWHLSGAMYSCAFLLVIALVLAIKSGLYGEETI